MTGEPLRIGIVCYPTHGGSGVVAVELAHKLADRGHEVHVVSYSTPMRLDTLHRNIRFHPVKVMDYPLFEYPPYSLALAAQLAEVVCNHQLDVLHVHYAIPHAVSAWMARQIARRDDMPVITTLHGTDITIVGNDPAYLPVTRYSLEVSDTVTVVSRWLGERVNKVIGCRVDPVVVYNFVDGAEYKPRTTVLEKRLNDSSDAPVMMHMSNFRPVKRIGDVVDAFLGVREHMRARLVLVGDGPDRLAAETRLKGTPYAGDVFFIGMQTEIEEILPAADLFLFPSNAESFGLAALEAQASGVPVVGYRAGGLPEVVEDGVTGRLVEPEDVEALTGACLDLLRNRKLRKSLGRAGRKRAVEHFGPDLIVSRYEELYRSSMETIRREGPKPIPGDISTPCEDFGGA